MKIWMQEWKKMCKFNSNGDSYLYVGDFKEFLTLIEQPLGVGQYSDESMILERIRLLRLPVSNGRVYLEDALFAAAFRVACLSNPCFGNMRSSTSEVMTVSG